MNDVPGPDPPLPAIPACRRPVVLIRGRTPPSEAFLGVAAALLAGLLLLYLVRFLDNNTLVSWRWVFDRSALPRLVLSLAAGLTAAWFLARRRWSGRLQLVLLAIFPLAAAIAGRHQPEMLLDAGRYLIQASFLRREGLEWFFREWGGQIPAWTDLPLAPAAYGILFTLFGENRLGILIFNAGLLFLTMLLVRAIGTRLWGRETGLAAALLLAGSPFLLSQLPLMLVDVPAMFLVTLATAAYLRATGSDSPSWLLLASLSLGAALLVKFSTWPMLLVLPLFSILAGRRPAWKRGLWIGAGGLGLLTPFLLTKARLLRHQFELLATFQRQGLQNWQESFASIFLFQICPLLLLLALAGAWRALHRKERTFWPWLWLFAFLVLFQAWRIRYLLPLLPLLALMAAYGLGGINQRGLRRLLALAAAFWGLTIFLAGYQPFLARTSMANLTAAGRILDQLAAPAAEVLFLPQRESSGSSAAAIPLLDLQCATPLFCRQPWPSDRDERYRQSPLRFTRSSAMPAFYRPPASAGRLPLAVISPEPLTPAQLREIRQARRVRPSHFLEQRSGRFRYRTMVTLFRPEE